MVLLSFLPVIDFIRHLQQHLNRSQEKFQERCAFAVALGIAFKTAPWCKWELAAPSPVALRFVDDVLRVQGEPEKAWLEECARRRGKGCLKQ